jgi:fibronectin type 3 domain-containing protein
VAARNAAGEGPESDAAWYQAAALPSAVGQPLLLNSSCVDQFVYFKWTRPMDDGGCPILRYRVLRNNVVYSTAPHLGAAELTYLATGLTCGVQYDWKIEAENCLGIFGSESPTLRTYTASITKPVTGLNASHLSSTSLLFVWDPLVSSDEIGSTDLTILRGYDLYIDDGLGGDFTRAYSGFNKAFETSFVASDLVPLRTYRAYVRGINTVGDGEASEIIYRTMATEPEAPTGLYVVTAGDTAVTCSWEPSSYDGGDPVQHYVLEYAPEPLFNAWEQDSPLPDNTQFSKQITSLRMGTLYQFRISAFTSIGQGTPSGVVTHIVGSVPQEAPTGLTRQSTTSVSLTWGWLPLDKAYYGGAPLGGYRLYMNTGMDDPVALIYDGGTSPSVTSFTATGLVCGRQYIAQVSAITRIGDGPNSTAVAFVLAHAPSQPRSARVTASSTSSIALAWEIPESTGCAKLEQYKIERDSGSGFQHLAYVVTPTQVYTDSDASLQAGSVYIYRISAKNEAIATYGAHCGFITAYASSLPVAISNLGYVSSTRTSITLQWDAPDDDGGAAVEVYRVQMDNGLGSDFADAAVVTTTYATITALVEGRPYRFRVAAETPAGTGPYSNALRQNIAEEPGAPAAPTVTSIPGYQDRFQVSWPEPLNNGGSLVLGYKVVLDGDCDRYDGTHIASLTTVQIRCIVGQSHLVTVAARNLIGWGAISPAVARSCGSEPGIPQNFGLKVVVPARALDVSDLRTANSIMLKWSSPTDTGGLPLTKYQVFIDGGDASGKYSLAYEGLSTEAIVRLLTKGRTYRFYVLAYNSVGAGSPSPIFKALMSCIPRPVAAAPYKASGSPWHIALEWPKTVDDCGASVTGYRIYRDGVLIHPLSNSFLVQPYVSGESTSDAVTLKFTAAVNGFVWTVVLPGGAANAAPVTTSVQGVKQFVGAMGRATCRRNGTEAVLANDEHTLPLHGCGLTGGGYYSAFVYVESTTGLDDDGTLYGPLPFYLKPASNSFAMAPKLDIGNLSKDGVSITFSASESAGFVKAFVVSEANVINVGINETKSLAYAEGDVGCKFTSFLSTEVMEVTLHGCNLLGNENYSVFVYVEDGHLANDGTLAEPIPFTVPPGGAFVDGPHLAGTPSTNQVDVKFTAVGSAATYAVVVEESVATSVTLATVKSAAGVLCSASCLLSSGCSTGVGQEGTISILSCALTYGSLYKAFVYVEDADAGNDGDLSAPIDVHVPAQETSNTFAVYPTIVMNETGFDGEIQVDLTATHPDGRAWLTIVEDSDGQCMSIRKVKYLVGAYCSVWGESIGSDPVSLLLQGCLLKGGTKYRVFAYVEDAFNGDDGTLSPPLEFFGPPTNDFAVDPIVVLDSITPDGLTLEFTPALPGLMWAMVAPAAYANWIDNSAVKAGTFSVGGPGCRKKGVSVSSNMEQATLSNCSLQRGTDYRSFIYVEGPASHYDDGTLSAPIPTYAPATSMFFLAGPDLTSTPSMDVVRVGFNATFSDTPDVSGEARVWVMVVTSQDALSVTPRSVTVGTDAQGASSTVAEALNQTGCFYNMTFTSQVYVELELNLCYLKHATTYKLVVYIEDMNGRFDGKLELVDVPVPPGISNGFISFPNVTSGSSNDEIYATFTASEMYGRVWAAVVPQAVASVTTIASIMSFQHALGMPSCRKEGSEIIGGTAVTIYLHGCYLVSLTPYIVFVYISGMGGHDDGSLTSKAYTTPNSNFFVSAPVVGPVTSDGFSVNFQGSKFPIGFTWAMVVLPINQQAITLAWDGIKTSHSYALGMSTCRHDRTNISNTPVQLDFYGCGLTPSMTYKLFVYIEDEANLGDGTLEGPFDVVVTGSNTFTVNPVVEGVTTLTSVSLKFSASSAGAAWVGLYPASTALTSSQLYSQYQPNLMSASQTSLYSLMGGIGTICGLQNVGIAAGETVLTLGNCTLFRQTPYVAKVYIETGGNPGTLEQVNVYVPLSNTFAIEPSISGSPTRDGVTISFAPTALGKVWGVVVEASDAASINVSTIKVGTGAISYWCVRSAVAISTLGSQDLSFTGCNMKMASTHKAFIYVEDDNGLDDGSVSDPLDIVLPPSNTFAPMSSPGTTFVESGSPILSKTPDTSTWQVSYRAAGPGKVWAVVVNDAANFTSTPAAIKAQTGVVGPSNCIVANGVIPYPNAGTLQGSSCSGLYAHTLQGSTYKVYVYVEDNLGQNDGSIVTVPFQVPPATASNSFQSGPRLASHPTGNGFNLTFDATSFGVAYALVVPKGAAMTTSLLLSGYGALGSGTCGHRYPGYPINSSGEAINFSGCALEGGQSYDAYVYVADVMGATDGVLSNPVDIPVAFSNQLSSPVIIDSVTGDSVNISINTTYASSLLASSVSSAGRVWLAVFSPSTTVTVTLSQVAHGSYCALQDFEISTDQDASLSVSGCLLLGGHDYILSVYVADDLGYNDGQLTTVLISIPFSNVLTVQPFFSGTFTQTIRIGFSAQSAGKAFVKALRNDAPVYTDVVALATASSNDVSCDSGSLDVVVGQNVLVVSNCALIHSVAYKVYVYVAGPGMLTDGTFASPPLSGMVSPGSSNVFTTVPDLLAASFDNVTVTFDAERAGRAFAIVVKQSDVGGVSISSISQWTIENEVCSLQGVPIVMGANVLSITGCTCEAETSYSAFVYITNEQGGDDGTLSLPMQFFVPASNAMITAPYLATVPTSDGLEVKFVPKSDGQAVSIVVLEADAGAVSVSSVQAGANAICTVIDDVYAGMESSLVFTGCGLFVLERYALFVYLQGANGGLNDGVLTGPQIVIVPASNEFLVPPELSSTPTTDGAELSFSVASAGYAYVSVVDSTLAMGLMVEDVMTYASALGGANCKLTGQPVTRGSIMATLTGCGLMKSKTYSVLVYIAGAAGGMNGTLATPVTLYLPPSNAFATLPAVTATPTKGGAHIKYAATATLGKAWATIVSKTISTTVVASGIKSMGSGAGLQCLLADVAIGNQILYPQITGCSLIPGDAYVLAVYVEDTNALDDGTLHLVDISVPAGVSNYFTDNPTVLPPVTSDSLAMSYRVFTSGSAWVMVITMDEPIPDIPTLKLAKGSLGASTCKVSSMEITWNTKQILTLSDCGLVEGVTYRLLFYIEDVHELDDGLVEVIEVNVPHNPDASVDPLVRSYHDLDVSAGGAYTYHVRAVNVVGSGEASAAANDIRAASAPASPGLPIVASRTLTSINLMWSPPSNNGADITRYRVFMKTGSGDAQAYKEVYTGPDNSFTKPSLETGQVYHFRVTAINILGEGPPSASRSTSACVVPDIPGNLLVKTRSINRILIGWEAPASDGGCPISAYEVMQDGIVVSQQKTTEYEAASVVSNQAYLFTVRCLNAVAASPFAPAINVVAARGPEKVQSLSVVSQLPTGIGLQWQDVPEMSGGSELTGYEVYISELSAVNVDAENVPYTKWGSTNSLTTSVVVSPLNPGARYCFKVAATNIVTEISALNDQQARKSDSACGWAATVPTPPNAIYFVKSMPGEIMVTYTPITNDGGARVNLYELMMNPNNQGWEHAATNSGSDLSYTHYGCTAGDTILWKVRARNAVGWGPFSSDFSTFCSTAPEQMLPPAWTGATRNSISFQWSPPNDNGAPTHAYRLYKAAGSGPFTRIYDGPATHFTATALATGTTYRFMVAAVNDAGEGIVSVAVPVVAASVPGKPREVAFTLDSRTATVLSWLPPIDDGGQEVIYYEVWYKEGLTPGPLEHLAWTGSGLRSDGLSFKSGVSYQFQVGAVNAVTNAQSLHGTRSDISFWHAGVLSEPPLVTLAASSLTSVTLSWTAPADSGGLPISGYKVYVDDGFGGPMQLAYSGLLTSYTKEGLATGYTYHFEVRAITIKGDGHSAAYDAVPCNVPGSVEALSVLEQTSARIRIGWGAPPGTGEAPILGYTILAGTSSNALVEVGTTPSVTDTVFDFIPPAPDTDYYVRVHAENWKTQASNMFSGAPSTTLHVISAAAPSVPQNVSRTKSGTESGLTTMQLSWNPPLSDGGSPIYEYFIYRNDGIGGSDLVDATGGVAVTSSPFTVKGLTTGYYYMLQIAAVNRAVGTNVVANYESVHMFAADTPSAPATPQANSRTPSGFTLSWSAPSNSGGIALLGYRVYRDNGAGDSIDVLLWNGDNQPTITNFAVTGLFGGITYRFTVTAINSAGEGPPSTPLSSAGGYIANATTLARNLNIVPLEDAISLTWSPPADTGGSPITGYKLVYDDGNYGLLSNELLYDATVTNVTVTSLTPGSMVRFVLYSLNAVGWSHPSPVYRTQSCANPDQVTSFAVSEQTDNSVTFSWSPPSSTGCASALVTGYKIYMSQGANVYSLVYNGSPAVLYYVHTGMTIGLTYYFKINVCTEVSCDIEWPTTGQQILAGSTPVFPAPAMYLYADVTQPTILELGWYAPPGLPILDYEIQWDNGGGAAMQGAPLYGPNVGTATYLFKDTLNRGEPYRFQIRAQNANGWGPWSGIVKFMTVQRPNAPQNLRFTSSTLQSIEITWDEPVAISSFEDASSFVRYETQWSDLTTDSTPEIVESTPAFRSMMTSTPLTAGHTYRFEVRTCNYNYCGSYTSALDLVCGSLPEPPSIPYAVSTSASQITLGWSYVGKDNGGVPIQKYKVYASVDGGSTYVLSGSTPDASVHSYTYACGAQQTFYFTVAAVNGVGGSSGEGTRSEPIGIYCGLTPNKPPEPTRTATAATLTVELAAPGGALLNGVAHAGWRILVDDAMDADDIFVETAVYDTTITSYTFTSGITTGHAYRVGVKVCSTVGCSISSDIARPVYAVSPPAAPSPLYKVASDDTSITVGWGFSGSNGGSPITGWTVYWSEDGTTWPATTHEYLITSVPTMQHTVTCPVARQMNFMWFKVAAQNTPDSGQAAQVGDISQVLTARCSAAPDTPAAPTLVSSSSTHITISWSAVTQAELHNSLYLGNVVSVDDGTGGPFTSVTISDTLQNQFTKTGVSAGLVYRFKIQTLSQVGGSADSTVVEFIAAGVPDPVVVTDVTSTATSITYTWALTSNGGSSITGYELFFSSDGTTYDYTTPTQVSAATTSYTVDCTTAFSPSRSKQYVWLKLRALAGLPSPNHLEGPLSLSLRHRCSPVPDQPAQVQLVGSSANTVTISYATLPNLHDAYITGFKIYTDDGNSGPWSEDLITDTTQLTFTKYGLTSGLPYKFKIIVVSEVGESATSTPVQFYSAATPNPPTLSVSTSSNAVVNLQWTQNYDGGASVTNWRIYGSVDGTTWPTVSEYVVAGSVQTLALDCTDSSKWQDASGAATTVSQSYVYLKVSGANPVGYGVPSNSYRWRCSNKPVTPAAPVKTGATSSSITISYAPTAMEDAMHLGYKIYYDDGLEGLFQETFLTITSQMEYTIPGLIGGRRYRIYVVIVSEVGDSDPSPILYVTCGADADAPSAPYYISSQNNNELTVGWSFPGSNGGAPITNWCLYTSNAMAGPYDEDCSLTVSTMQKVFDCTSMGSFGDLSQNNIYVKVVAQTEASIGTHSPVSRIFCANKPDAPVVYDVSGSESSVTFSWEPYTGSLNGADLMGYRIYISDGLGGTPTLHGVQEDTSKKFFTVEGLQPNRLYHVHVTVVSTVGESALSATISPLRSCGFPAVPNAPTRHGYGAVQGTQTCESIANAICLKWQAPADNGCPIESYNVERVQDLSSVPKLPAELWHRVAGLDANANPVEQFRITACNARGCTPSLYSYLKVAAEPAKPNKPEQEPYRSTSTSIGLKWGLALTVPDVIDWRGGTAVGYKIYRNNGQGTAISSTPDLTCQMETRPAPQNCALKGLLSGETYLVRLVAINDIGDSEPSDIAEMRAATIPETINFDVANFLADWTPLPTLTFAWFAPSDNGAFVYNYKGFLEGVSPNAGPLAEWDAQGTTDNPITVTSVTFTQLAVAAGQPDIGVNTGQVALTVNGWFTDNAQFKFTVTAINSQGESNSSAWSSITEAPAGWTLGAPITPANFGRHTDTPVAGAVKLGWDAITTQADAAGSWNVGIVPNVVEGISYEVWGGPDVFNMVQQTMVSSSNNYHEQAVPAGSSWWFKVRSKNKGGQTSSFTTAAEFVSAQVPNPPASFTAVSTNVGSVTCSWSIPTYDGGSVITKYKITQTIGGAPPLGVTTNIDVENYLLSATFSNLGAGVTAQFDLVASNAVGDSAVLTQSLTVLN